MTAFVVVITGASAGIGRALAVNLARKAHGKTGQSFKMLLLARKEDPLKEAVAACNEAAGGKEVAKYFVADVTKKEQVDAAADFAVKTFGRIDVWVNNAGGAVDKHALELTPADIEPVLAANVYSALYGTQAAVRVFKAQTPVAGQIINVTSVLGRVATFMPRNAAYNGAKHFLNALTDNLRQDLQADEKTKNIVVTLYSPGTVLTQFCYNNGIDFDNSVDPNAQTAEEVGESLRETIEQQKEDVYSRPAYKAVVDGFFASRGGEPAATTPQA